VLVVYNVEEKVGYWRFVRELTCAPGKNSQRIKIPIANTLDESNRARLEDLILLEVWSSVRDRFPTVREMSAAQRREIFPHSLAELPRPFVDGDRFDVLVVTGPTRYDLEKLEARFIKANDGFQDEKLGNKIELGDSAYNLSLCSEILSALSFQAGHRQCVLTAERRQLTYLEVNETTLANHNLILLPCGDVNPVLPLAIKRFEMKYRVTCPVHHDPKIESSEGIFDQLTRTRYSKGRDDQGVGFVALLPNPWNEDKAMLLCGGNKGVGTQAALLRVLMAIRGDRKLIDREGIPTAIVRGEFDRSTLFVTGVEDIT